MRRSSVGAALFVALAVALPATAANKNVPTDQKAAVDQMVAAGSARGRVVNVEADKKRLTLEISIKYAVPNPNAGANLRNLELQLATTRDPNQRRNLAMQLLRAQMEAARPNIKQEKHNIDVEAADDVVVRAMNPPVQFDDKGNVKKYTAKELKELKGDNPKLPGYTSDFDSLRTDQIVEVQFAKPKDQPKPKANNKDADKDALAETSKPVAKMILIISEPPAK